MSYRMGVLKGDGIGPEIVNSSMRILKTALSQFNEPFVEFVECPIGAEASRSSASIYDSRLEKMPWLDIRTS